MPGRGLAEECEEVGAENPEPNSSHCASGPREQFSWWTTRPPIDIWRQRSSRQGYEVDVVSSGAEVVPSIAAKSYLAMLLDVHLPGADGFEVAQAVRRFESQEGRSRTPIIALTADTLPETRTRLLAHSIDFVLHKPAGENEMLAAIASVQGQR